MLFSLPSPFSITRFVYFFVSIQVSFTDRASPHVDVGRFYTKDALSVWTNLGKYFVVRLGYASLA